MELIGHSAAITVSLMSVSLVAVLELYKRDPSKDYATLRLALRIAERHNRVTFAPRRFIVDWRRLRVGFVMEEDGSWDSVIPSLGLGRSFVPRSAIPMSILLFLNDAIFIPIHIHNLLRWVPVTEPSSGVIFWCGTFLSASPISTRSTHIPGCLRTPGHFRFTISSMGPHTESTVQDRGVELWNRDSYAWR